MLGYKRIIVWTMGLMAMVMGFSQSPKAASLELIASGGTVDSFVVAFKNSDGTELLPPTKVKAGEKLKRPPNPSKSGFTFVNWRLSGSTYDFQEPVTKHLVLIAEWKELEYTVSFNIVEGFTIAKVTVTHGKSVTRPADPVKPGFVFDTWTLAGEPYDFALPVVSNLSLMASWVDLPSDHYAVVFDSNGGSHVPSVAVMHGEELKRPLSPFKADAVFLFWKHAVTGEKYDFSSLVMNNIRLIAQWRVLDSDDHKVVFDSDGGTEIDDQICRKGQFVTRPVDPIKKGWVFKGWRDKGTPYSFNEVVNGDIKLKAEWEAPPTRYYVVSFDSEGGTAYESQVIEREDCATEPPIPMKKGYLFLRWRNGNSPYNFFSPVMDHLVLKAVWQKVDKGRFAVYFNSDGGTLVKTQVIKEGAVVFIPQAPMKAGHLFKGWLLEGNPYDFGEKVTKHLLLRADWEVITENHCIVSFETNGGTAVTKQVIKKGAVVVKPDNPTKSGYIFKEWMFQGVPYDFESEVLNDMTIEVAWRPVLAGRFTVIFNTDGGSYIPTEEIMSGKKAQRPPDPTKYGYLFVGWKLRFLYYSFSEPVTDNIVLRAVWEKVEMNHYVVTFNSDGGSFLPGQAIFSGHKASQPVHHPVKEGFLFDEWLLNDSPYDFNTPVKSDITLKASWRAAKHGYFTVVYDSKGATPIATSEVKAGTEALEPPIPTKKGYLFKGWMLDNVLYDFATRVSRDITLEALWVPLEDGYFVVHFDVNHGRPIPPITVKNGFKVDKPKNPVREGFYFKEWMLEGKPYNFDTKVSRDIILRARWVEDFGSSSPLFPAKEEVTIAIGMRVYTILIHAQEGEKRIELYTLLGNKICQDHFSGNEYRLAQPISQGCYILRVNEKVQKILY